MTEEAIPPTDLVAGRYRLIRQLGQGGMGSVFLAADLALERRPVALKRLLPSQTTREGIATLKLEFETMTGLRHPNIVEVYDFGTDEASGGHFLTMEYVEGTDLQEAASRLPLPERYELLVQVCRGLEYIHSRGLIHNDIKPQNILVTASSPVTCKLTDFGLALDRTHESGASIGPGAGVRLRGTLHYLAPELIGGQRPDRRSDIYALGIVFYRALTGRLPFDGEPSEILAGATSAQPDPLRRHVPELPAAVEAVVLGMLRKDPSARPPDAASIIRDLSRATGIAFEIETAVTLLSYARSGGFVGRSRELARLIGHLEAAAAAAGKPGPARLVMLSGESGVGKSRLVRQLRYEAQMRGGGFAAGSCYEGGSAPFQPFVQILRQLISHQAEPSPGAEAGLAPLLAAPGAPAVEGAAAVPIGGHPDIEAAQRRLIDAAVDALLAAARSRPLLLCLEDLQWADAASLSLLEHLIRITATEAPAGGLVLLATYRSEDAGAPPLSSLLPRLQRAAAWDQIELSRMGPEEVASLLSAMLGVSRPPGELVALLMRETEGNPFFVQTAVESLLEERAPGRDVASWLSDADSIREIAFPASAADAVSRRVARLAPPETQVLEALAVFEKPVEESLLREALGQDLQPAAMAGAVEGLIRRRLAAREVSASGALRLRLDHVRIRDQVYESMDWGRRRELHGRFGRALEAAGSAAVEELAHHYTNSPDSEKALLHAEQAGLRALSLFAGERAAHFLEAALELVPPSDALRRLRLHLNLADAYRQARDHQRAVEGYERIIKAARAAGLRDIAHAATCHLIDVHSITGRTDEAQRTAERMISTLDRQTDKQYLAICKTVLGSTFARRGDLEQARRLTEESLALRREIRDLPGMASCLNNLGLIDLMTQTSDHGRELLEESLALRRQLGDSQKIAEALGNMGYWFRKRGDLASAVTWVEQAAQMSRENHDRWLLGRQEGNLAATYHALGSLDRALESARRAVSHARATGDEELECESLDYLGMIERDLGRIAPAAEAHERAATLARRAGAAAQELYALSSLSLDRAAARDVRAAKELLRRASRVASSVNSPRAQARLHEAWARASLAASETAAALTSARAAVKSAEQAGIPEVIACGDLLLAECLHALAAAGGEAKPGLIDEARAAAGRAAALASAHGLAEPRWRAAALRSLLEKGAGRRAAEKEALREAAEAIEAVAAGLTDPAVREAYLAAPARAEILKKAPARISTPRGDTAEEASAERALSALYEITGILNSMSDLDTLLDRVLEVGLGIVGAERGLIILMDEAGGEQVVRAARDLEEETVADALAYSRSVVKEAATGRIIVAMDAREDDRFRNYKSVSLYSIKSLMCVPMKIRDRVLGTVYVDSRREGSPFTPRDLLFLEAFANLAASAVEQSRMQARLASENVYLKKEAGVRNRYQNIIGRNPKMQAIYDLMEKVAASTLPVLVSGESGTGKELVARALHYSGPRRNGKFFSENVAAIPDTLLESEMFGHVRGAFTGADRDRKGLFELADGGTLFLDEIGDMSLPMQSKLLRALQEGEIRPVGGKETRRVDVRVVSATNKDLEKMMKEGRFREDLYYRLNVVRVTLPPLRERKEDIPLLVDHFLSKIARDSGKPARRIELGALQLLLRYSWPGNVRELENEIQRLAVLAPGEVIGQKDVMESGELFEKITRLEERDAFTNLEELERRQIEKALLEAAGNRGRAAELLGISRATIFRKLRKFGISH